MDEEGEGTYTADGIAAFSEALCVNASLTQVLAFSPNVTQIC